MTGEGQGNGQTRPAIGDLVAGALRDIPDFPKPGILFKDIGPLLADPVVFGAVIEEWRARHTGSVDLVAGLEARGFLFAGALAHALGVGTLPVRKAGKLPGATIERSYDLEYGSATLAIQEGAITPGDRVLVVDDILATGGTARAACELIEQAGGRIVAVDVVMELAGLGGRAALERWPVSALTSD